MKYNKYNESSISVHDTLNDVKMQFEENWSAIYKPMMPVIIYYVTRTQSKHANVIDRL